MFKSVILITIAGTLWGAAGSALAQSGNAGNGPKAGVGQPVANGLLMAIPSVGALNRSNAVSLATTTDLVAAPQGQSGMSPDKENSAQNPGSSRHAREASLSADPHGKRLHQIPTCD